MAELSRARDDYKGLSSKVEELDRARVGDHAKMEDLERARVGDRAKVEELESIIKRGGLVSDTDLSLSRMESLADRAQLVNEVTSQLRIRDCRHWTRTPGSAAPANGAPQGAERTLSAPDRI